MIAPRSPWGPKARRQRDADKEARQMMDDLDRAHEVVMSAISARHAVGRVGPDAAEEVLWRAYFDLRHEVRGLVADALEAEERCPHEVRPGRPCAECDDDHGTAQLARDLETGGGETLAQQQESARAFK